MKVPAVINYMECNADNYKADLLSFQPDDTAKNADDMMTQDFGGCGSGTPYLVLYQLKEGEKTLFLKSDASETASDVASVSSNETLAEIRTVDDLTSTSSKSQETAGHSRIFERTGGSSSAYKEFDALSPSDIKEIPGGRVDKLSDGRTVIVRDRSTDGRPNLEIQLGKNQI
ncbi:hypothetical protein ACUY4R_003404 [Kosakonia sp. BK9b]